ncbi:MAG: tRNA-dihydrouridine synthase family protein [Bdellovibrionales bacterium]|nr:tRNA-dihydrouridine synthase family protein [Bdellovibrionales bacterium]
MEGVVDPIVRQMWSAVGGIDHMVTEFVRVTDKTLPDHVFYKYSPELKNGGLTDAGTPVYVQLLGGQPEPMAENAFKVFALGAPGLDLNFGCPAKTVNRHDGGAALLKNPHRLYDIISAIRKVVPKSYPVTAKVRLGFEDKSLVREISQACSEGGALRLTVHARTKVEGYKPPAHWEFIAIMKEVSKIPVIANGDIWNLEDYRRCREISGCTDVALGRCLMARPDLGLQIKAETTTTRGLSASAWDWPTTFKHVQLFYQTNLDLMSEQYAARRLKQYLKMLANSHPEALEVFAQIKRLHGPDEILHELQQVPELSDYLQISPKAKGDLPSAHI